MTTAKKQHFSICFDQEIFYRIIIIIPYYYYANIINILYATREMYVLLDNDYWLQLAQHICVNLNYYIR